MVKNRFQALLLLAMLTCGCLLLPQVGSAQAGADQAAALRKDIERDEERLVDLQLELTTRNTIFEENALLQADLEDSAAELEQQLVAGEASPEDVVSLNAQLVKLNERVEQERRKAQLVFDAGKVTRAEIKLMEEKLAREKKALAVLLGKEVIEVPGVAAAVQELPESAADVPASAKSSVGGLLAGVLPAEKTAAQTIAEPSGKISLAETAEQIQARKNAEKAATAALIAEAQLNGFVERKQNLEDQIGIEQQQLAIGDDALVVLREERVAIQAEILQKKAAGESATASAEMRARLELMDQDLDEVNAAIELRRERLAKLQARLEAFDATQEEIVAEVERTRVAAERASEHLVWVKSPLNPANILQWARVRGTGLMLVLGVMLGLLWLVRFSARGIIRGLVRSAQSDRATRAHRADTLATSLSGVITGVFLVFAIMMVLQEAGVDVATVLGGAAILGVAVAFGAQNLMRDYFNGIMILLEDQYGLDDLVTIGTVEGRVERVNMRTTVVRDIEGRLHFIPNGQIAHVTNRSYEWSRAMFDIPVPYSCDVDQAMAILMDVANDFCEDMNYTSAVADKPEMLGVNEFAESSIIIRFFIKTAASMQLPVKREMLRRIKNRFDKEGIAIPFPHRIIIRGDN